MSRVFSWYGATIEMYGATETDYTADEVCLFSQTIFAFPNEDLYKVLVKELAQILERQFAGNAESRAAGIVINTMGWIENIGYESLLLHSIDALKANVVLVLGQVENGILDRDLVDDRIDTDLELLKAQLAYTQNELLISELARDISGISIKICKTLICTN
ncbi:hypothetical protein RHGRI_028419 [Rhododendron griersonianum]|uniref:Clp1 P-loop domain-containing protein n=1 Tax=Rhododendron griersonianum TaxID=479676 RepID=A0AAV6ILQ3_9ERIC|nr:hypothetical protein RHGRI_028419 [Rhododendron griersonianum]